MNEEKSEFQKRLDERLLNYGGGLGGMMVGQSLDAPLKQLSADIQLRNLRKLEDTAGEKVTSIYENDTRARKRAEKRLRKKRLKGYIPKPGIPKSKAALVGGAVGSLTLPLIVSSIQEERASKEVVNELEKEAFENYTLLPKIEVPKNFL